MNSDERIEDLLGTFHPSKRFLDRCEFAADEAFDVGTLRVKVQSSPLVPGAVRDVVEQYDITERVLRWAGLCDDDGGLLVKMNEQFAEGWGKLSAVIDVSMEQAREVLRLSFLRARGVQPAGVIGSARMGGSTTWQSYANEIAHAVNNLSQEDQEAEFELVECFQESFQREHRHSSQ